MLLIVIGVDWLPLPPLVHSTMVFVTLWWRGPKLFLYSLRAQLLCRQKVSGTKPAVDVVHCTLRTVLETLFCRCTYCGPQERYSKNTRPLKDCSKGTGEIKKYESHKCIDQIYMWPLDWHSIGVLHFCCIKSERVGSKSSKLFISFNQNEVYWLSHVDGEKNETFCLLWINQEN